MAVRTAGAVNRRPWTGFTLAELLVGLVVAAVVLGAAFRLVEAARALARDQAVVLDVRQNVRAAALVLQAELRALAPAAGDVVSASDTSVTIKALRTLSALCAPPSVGSATITLRDAVTSGLRAIDPARDSVLVYRDGEPLRSSDDRWLHADVAGVRTGAACSDGSSGTELTLTGIAGGPAELAGVTEGAPVRVFETTSYRLYADASGEWWMGERSFSGGAWSVTSPIAGPLRPRDGLALRYRDGAGASAAAPAAIADVEIAVRGRSRRPLRTGVGAWAPFLDSSLVRAAPRND
jgi:hypothetical protein